MADIGSITLKITPDIDIPAFEASLRSAIADALEQLAAEVRGEEPATAPRLAPGSSLTIGDLEALPVGAVVRDGDGDPAYRLADNPGRSYGHGHDGVARYSLYPEGGADLPSSVVASYGTVTLVSLP